jgi:fructose-1,6-bisphosphatase/inositol monophosphatase family enzyme
MGLLEEVASAVAKALETVVDRGPSGRRKGQYALDLVADDAALAVLRRAGVGILSEESGLERGRLPEIVVIDPVDGSTNASRGVPWYATSLCLVDADGPATALVVNQASGVRYSAERGGGAWCDGDRLASSGCTEISAAIVGLNGTPPRNLGYAQSRVFGAVALDLCLVAAGVLDGYIDCIVDAHGVWDYAGATLICVEAGVQVVDVWDRDLYTLTHEARRTPVAAATTDLLESLVVARRGMAG